MSIVKSKDNRTGITYVYESESYWDKEKQQPRARRKLIGKLDETTGEVIPTGSRGRKKKEDPSGNSAENGPSVSAEAVQIKELSRTIWEKDAQIRKLTAENEKLRKEKASFLKSLNALASGYMSEA